MFFKYVNYTHTYIYTCLCVCVLVLFLKIWDLSNHIGFNAENNDV